jgi:hypothetical protein
MVTRWASGLDMPTDAPMAAPGAEAAIARELGAGCYVGQLSVHDGSVMGGTEHCAPAGTTA